MNLMGNPVTLIYDAIDFKYLSISRNVCRYRQMNQFDIILDELEISLNRIKLLAILGLYVSSDTLTDVPPVDLAYD